MRQFNETSPISASDFVGVIARSANWPGDEANLFRAVPFAKTGFGPFDFLTSLENLGVKPLIRNTDQHGIREDELPCIFLQHGEPPKLITRYSPKALTAIEVETGEEISLKRDRTPCAVLKAVEDPDFQRQNAAQSIFDALQGLGSTVAPLIFSSLLINLLALAGPLLVMTVYDTVIPSQTESLVWSFAALVTALISADLLLRCIRAEVLARIGAAAERRMSLALFTKLMNLPLAQVSRSTTHQQMNRIRQFESVRDVFSGTLLVNLLDFPFIFLFLAVIFAIAPLVGFFLVGVMSLFVVATIFAYPRISNASTSSSKAQFDQMALLNEVSENGKVISRFGLSDAYAQRCEKLSFDAAQASRASRSLQSLFTNITQLMVGLGVLCSIAFASILAMQSAISFGALIAITTLSGRVLGPVQSLCTNILRFKSIVASCQNINATLGLNVELSRGHAQSRLKTFEGAISARSVFVKFEAANEASLTGVSFEIAPRKLVVLAGKSAAGKSTLLKSMVRLHAPSSGSFHLQGINIKQIAVDDLRHAVSLSMEENHLFDFTLRENLLLGNPRATDQTVHDLYAALDATKDLRRFHRGLDTDLSHVARANLSGNVLGTMSIVRCLAKEAAVYMLDDPFVGMTSPRIASVWSHLKEVSKTATVVVVTNQLSHLLEADQVIMLDKGRVALDGSGEDIGPKAHAMLNLAKGF